MGKVHVQVVISYGIKMHLKMVDEKNTLKLKIQQKNLVPPERTDSLPPSALWA